ncbi:MAG: methionyl-tRNA formyltransferase [Lentimonas sp.]|jgi:methionyl-tRNA formyltransferase
MNNISIVFMGTPEFAVTILDKLHSQGVNIKAVITAPDKPAGRGRKILQSDVMKYATEKELNVLQPTNLKSDEFVDQLKSINADLFVVVAFRMLPEVVWGMPKMGTINLHGSLLPQYRGAAPINWALINGERKSGVTTFFIEKEIDTGNIIDTSEVEITQNMNAGELHDRLAAVGAELMLKTVLRIEKGDVESKQQDLSSVESIKHAPKIFKEDCKINWNNSAQDIHNFIRGLSPYPAAYTELKKGEEVISFKIFDSIILEDLGGKSNQIVKTKEGFLFPCRDKSLLITDIQMQGKRRMNFKDFSAGNNIEEYQIQQ